MFKITNILNPLTGGATTEEHTWESGKPLSEYMDYDGECVVAHSGKIIPLSLSKIFPANTDEYMVMPIPIGGDRQTWRLLGMSTLSTMALAFPSPYTAAAFIIGSNLLNLFLRDKEKDLSLSQSYTWKHASSPTAAHGAAMPIIYGKARIRPILKNRYITTKDDKQILHALYGLAAHKVDEKTIDRWSDDPPRSYAVRDEVITILEQDEPGKTYVCIRAHDQVTPGVGVPFYINENYWKVGHGTAAFADDIVINGRAIEDYDADAEWETRPGLPEQAIIIGFDVTYSNFAQDEILYLNYIEINRKVANVEYEPNLIWWEEHNALLFGQSYRISSDTSSVSYGNYYYIYFDPAYPTEYLVAGNYFPGDKYWVAYINLVNSNDADYGKLRYPVKFPGDDDWFSPVITLTAAHNIELAFEFPYGLYGNPAGRDTISATCRLFAQYRERGTERWLNFHSGFADPDHTEPYANSDITAIVVTRNLQDSFNISIMAVSGNDPLEYEKEYEIRVAASSPSIVRLVNVATLVYGAENLDESAPGFTYPGEPLLGIKALASSQISGDLDIQIDVERSLVWVYNTRSSQWAQVAANNHAWAVYDILTNGHRDHPAYPAADNDDAEAIYGCGIDPDRIDYESFREWADNIDDLEYELNIVFDTFMTAWDAILRICQEGRGMIFPVGTKIHAFTDKATDVTQIFTMGNIHLDTLVQKYTEASEKVNMIEVNYYDQNRNYQKTTIAARTADWDSSTGLSVPVTITLYGTTTFDQAWSIARFILMGNELLDNIITFGVDVDALAAQAGDVVEVQHDVLTAGEGGRIKTVTITPGIPRPIVTIVFDRVLSMVAGRQYQLKIHHDNGETETKDGITGAANTDTLVFSGTWVWDTIPAIYEPYSFGVSGSHTKKYRITEISRTSELMRTLTLVQYDENLYSSYIPSDPAPVIPVGEFSLNKLAVSDDTVETLANLLNIASNLQLREVLSLNRATGEYESSIIVTWDVVSGDPRGSWEVWFRDVDVSDVDWEGVWEALLGGYAHGRKVEYNGKTYISLVDDNVGEPFSR